MQRTLAVDIPKHIGEDVKLVGWLFQVRELGSILFVVVRDRTGTAQAVILDPSKYDLSHLKRESLVEVYGTVKAEPQAKRGAELLFKEVKVLTEPVAELPFEVNRSKKKLNLKIDSVLDHRAFSLRNPEIAAPFKVQAEIVRTFADYLRGLGFAGSTRPRLFRPVPRAGPHSFPSSTLSSRPFWLRALSSTSRCSSGPGSSGSSKSALSTGPRTTRPHGTSTSIYRWTLRWASLNRTPT